MDQDTVAVFGLGYVGLPLAIFCAKKRMDVIGVDIDSGKVQLINQGRSPIEEPYIEDAFAQGLKIRATTQASLAKD